MEEIYLEGPLGNTDIRIINSYPSKVQNACPELQKSEQKSNVKSPKSPKVRKSESPKARTHTTSPNKVGLISAGLSCGPPTRIAAGAARSGTSPAGATAARHPCRHTGRTLHASSSSDTSRGTYGCARAREAAPCVRYR
jgi:hypothetical protein